MSDLTLGQIFSNPELLNDVSNEDFRGAFDRGIGSLDVHMDSADIPEPLRPFIELAMRNLHRQTGVEGHDPFAEGDVQGILQGLLRQQEDDRMLQFMQHADNLMDLFTGNLPAGMSIERALSSMPPGLAGAVGPMIMFFQRTSEQDPQDPEADASEAGVALEPITVDYDEDDHTPGDSYINMNAANIEALGGSGASFSVYELSDGDFVDTERAVTWDDITDEFGSDLNFVTLSNDDGLAYVQVYPEGGSVDDAVTLGLFNDEMDLIIDGEEIAAISTLVTTPQPAPTAPAPSGPAITQQQMAPSPSVAP